ncbi:TonB-dependent receptor [Bacteroidales bacterium OttesenSCG-928-B11]|nr:TonB-dependent receptor [Bacteroidales bacterium OttesenSCG-928-B11]MDL2325740.1 TonB-dependent receptor [Bacteroidales bacterium OttesenSCG-928-A14]
MIKKLLLTIGVLLCCVSFAFSQAPGTLQGIVKDNFGTALGMAEARIILYQENDPILDAWIDGNGSFKLSNIQPGTYDLEAMHLTSGRSQKKTGIYVAPDAIEIIDFEINLGGGEDGDSPTMLKEIVVKHKKPVVDMGDPKTQTTIDGEQLQKSPGRSATSALATAEGVSSIDGNIMSVRGNRSDGQVTIIDGVRMRGSGAVAMQSMDAAQLIQGGIPAEYGDGTSFQVFNTRGVPRNFSSSVELRGSVDGYNNFLGAATVSGPILKGKDSTRIRMGFMLSGEGYFNQDSRPLRGGSWVAKDEVIQSLIDNPMRYSNTEFGAFSSNASYLLEDAFEKRRVRQNAENWGFIIQGKIDIQPIKSADLAKANSLRISLNAMYDYGQGKSWGRTSSLFNNANNAISKNSTMRLFARVSHMVIRKGAEDSSKLKNLTYDFNVSYTKYNYEAYDKELRDNFFAYGHLGKFTTHRASSYSLSDYTAPDSMVHDNVYVFTGVYDSLITYTPGPYNQDLANYNLNMLDQFGPDILNDFYGYQVPYNFNIYQQFGGLLNGDRPSSVYSMYPMPGINAGGYVKSESSTWGAKASLTMNVGAHELKLGFELDRPSSRYHSVSANSLWTLMRQHTNSHFKDALDTENPIWNETGDTVRFNYLPALNAQSTFDRNLREKLGYDPNGTDWIDVDNLDPSTFDLSMFSAEELLVGTTAASQMVSYYGYDYTGKNKYKKKTDIDDFFNGRDENGNRTYNVGAYEPVYMAMYLQDRFVIRTLVFNVGVRVDRFDANQSVLKDPYLFRPAHTVGSIKEEIGEGVSEGLFVSNARDNWVVYVDRRDEKLDLTNSSIIGYRDGNDWYDASGQAVVDADNLMGANGGPILLDEIDRTLISKVDAKAFMDYETNWSVMPRLSFSFPVSTSKSRFTAHYNIVTNRPPNLQLDPVSYLFIEKYGKNQSFVVSNPNLRPQKSIEYELGFSQALGDDAAINITAYYSEKRDMIQTYRYTQAYPSTYYSYANLDFGTVQGFSISYLMRDIKNVTLRAGYTLQFAKGTGSSASSNLAIIQSGQPNLRTLTNLEFDQRHRFSLNLGYTLGTGLNYIGPTTTRVMQDDTKKEIRWFENMSFNLIFSAASGLPYSKSSIAYSGIGQGGASRLSGTINGSHKPWTFQCDLRIDRTFMLEGKAKEDGKKAKKSSMTVYVDVTNLFNFKNILGVYTYTGNPEDDGYLTATEYQQQINSQISVDSYKWYYNMAVKNPYNYSAPTRVSLGFMFNF